jgi:ribosomal protein S18 acetylase RimI-like enzyme
MAAIRILTEHDAALFGNVADDVFDAPINPAYLAAFLADPRHHIAAAIEDGVIVGFASGVDYLHPDKPPELWINEVGVAPTHQGRGIGRRLVDALLAHGRTLGCRTAWVLTEAGNAPARALYAAAGGSLDPAPGDPDAQPVLYVFEEDD